MTDTRAAIDALWRFESPRVIAALVRIVRDVDLAEDLAHDALVEALERWPSTGVPDRPGAWLTTTAKRRAIDRFRRDENLQRKYAEIAHALEETVAVVEPDEDAGDDMLRLIFIACHPVLSREARAALTLRLLGGLTTDEIAHAFLVSEPTIAQRIVRAKRALASSEAVFEMPAGVERSERLASVLEVLYLVFNEGYSATSGAAWTRPDLCFEALRLARVLATLAPNDAEVYGLLALLELQASRLRARTSQAGEPVLLLDQDRTRWDQLLMRRGFTALERALALSSRAPGPYSLQASIAACHARAHRVEETDWEGIAALYGELAAVSPSPVVELNRAVAIAMVDGPAAGLELVDALAATGALSEYHLLPSVRGDLLSKLGRGAEAKEEFARAAAMTRNERERALLLARAASAPSG